MDSLKLMWIVGGAYRSVVATASKRMPTRFSRRRKAGRPDVYVVSMTTWCPLPNKMESYWDYTGSSVGRLPRTTIAKGSVVRAGARAQAVRGVHQRRGDLLDLRAQGVRIGAEREQNDLVDAGIGVLLE